MQLAFVAGAIWLDSGLNRTPSDCEIASIADRLDETADSLAVARASVDVADSVRWVLGCREKLKENPRALQFVTVRKR